ncbi:hypothetical protein FRC01_009285 [Tulasnella sp. 417]|nr:hypothetical protein FRC01_009285 [Tulasnella sp. 417]
MPQTPPPTTPLAPTSPSNMSVSTTLPFPHRSITLNQSLRTYRKLVFESNSDYSDEQTKGSTAASDPTATMPLRATLAAPLSGGVRQESTLYIPRIAVPSLPTVTADTQPATVKSPPLSTKPSFDSVLGVPTAAEVHGVVDGDCSLSRARHHLATLPVPSKSSTKMAANDLNIIDPAGWRGKSLDEIAAALRSRATPIVPQPITKTASTPSRSPGDGKTPVVERSGLTALTPAALARTTSGFQVRVEEGGFSILPVEKALREPKLDVHTSVGAGGKNDRVDNDGFLKSDVERGFIKSMQSPRSIETEAVQTMLLPPPPSPVVSTGIGGEVVPSSALPPRFPRSLPGRTLRVHLAPKGSSRKW